MSVQIASEYLVGLTAQHTVKVTAVFSLAALGIYVIYHNYIRRRPAIAEPEQQQLPRRHRRLYTNDGRQLAQRTESEIIQSEQEYIATPEQPTIERMVQAVISSGSYRQLVNDNSRYLQSRSRDLTPTSKRPITSVVAGKYHLIRSAAGNLPPPPGYVPVHTNSGGVFYRRMPGMNRLARNPPSLVLRVPFETWNNHRMRRDESLGNIMQLFVLPTDGVNPRISIENIEIEEIE